MEYKLEDAHALLRLNFAPQHIADGKVLPSAINLQDLETRGFSLDAEPLVQVATLVERAASQSASKPEERKSPFLSRFQYIEVREIELNDAKAFDIFHSPVAEDAANDVRANFAHVSLLCTKAAVGKSQYRKARLLLLPYLQNLVCLNAYISGLPREA